MLPLEVEKNHPAGRIPDDVLNGVFLDISVHLPLVEFRVDWKDWERSWAHAVQGKRLGSNTRLVDVECTGVAWSVKSMESGISASRRVSAITSRLDVEKHRRIRDFSKDIARTGTAALEMWNEKIDSEHQRYKRRRLSDDLDLRLLIIGRFSNSSMYVFHERDLVEEDVGAYAWSSNKGGNLEGFVGREHRATFLRNGLKLVLHYNVRQVDPQIRYHPPRVMPFEEARKVRGDAGIDIFRNTAASEQMPLL